MLSEWSKIILHKININLNSTRCRNTRQSSVCCLEPWLLIHTHRIPTWGVIICYDCNLLLCYDCNWPLISLLLVKQQVLHVNKKIKVQLWWLFFNKVRAVFSFDWKLAILKVHCVGFNQLNAPSLSLPSSSVYQSIWWPSGARSILTSSHIHTPLLYTFALKYNCQYLESLTEPAPLNTDLSYFLFLIFLSLSSPSFSCFPPDSSCSL